MKEVIVSLPETMGSNTVDRRNYGISRLLRTAVYLLATTLPFTLVTAEGTPAHAWPTKLTCEQQEAETGLDLGCSGKSSNRATSPKSSSKAPGLKLTCKQQEAETGLDLGCSGKPATKVIPSSQSNSRLPQQVTHKPSPGMLSGIDAARKGQKAHIDSLTRSRNSNLSGNGGGGGW